MAATRIRKYHRATIERYLLNTTLDVEGKQKAELAQYQLTAMIFDKLAGRYPQDDMAVLEKYEQTQGFTQFYLEIRVTGSQHRSQRVEVLNEYGDLPTIPSLLIPRSCYVEYAVIAEDDPILLKYQEWQQLKNDWRKSEERLRAAYMALVDSSRTTEALIGQWPEAAHALQHPFREGLDAGQVHDLVHQNLIARGVIPAGPQ